MILHLSYGALYLVIMLANNQHLLQELDPATRSSLQPTPLHFKNYDAAQLQEILRERAQRGLHNWDEGTLAQIAAMTTRLVNSDARVAIKTLQYTVTSVAEKPISAFLERASAGLSLYFTWGMCAFA